MTATPNPLCLASIVDNILHINVSGIITRSNWSKAEAIIRESAHQALKSASLAPTTININLSAVDKVDSSALVLLLSLQRGFAKKVEMVTITSPPLALKHLAMLYNLA